MNSLVPLRVLPGIIRVVHSAFDSPEGQEKRRTAKKLRRKVEANWWQAQGRTKIAQWTTIKSNRFEHSVGLFWN
jgi:hypothetical protein